MKLFLIYCLCFFTLLKTSVVFSQDTINLLNGKQIAPRSIHEEQNSTLLYYDVETRGKLKQKAVDLLDVFSIDYANVNTKQIYQQDTGLGYILSIPEMKHYIIGERAALKCYKSPWVSAGGFALGAVDTYFIGFWGFLTPVVYGLGMGFIDSKIKAPESVKQTYGNNNNFINGYKVIATQKKVKSALLGSFAGAAAFVIADFLIINHHVKW
jgi:hypothetical protein